MKEEPKARRGSLKDQAPAGAYDDAECPLDRVRIAKLGRDCVLFRPYLAACRKVALFCPAEMPALPKAMQAEVRDVLELGWRMVKALKEFKRDDREFLERIMAIRGGRAFPQYRSGNSADPADALRTALCRLAHEQENAAFEVFSIRAVKDEESPGTFRPKTMDDVPKSLRLKIRPKTVADVCGWLVENAPECSIPTEKTIRQACKDAGVMMAKPGAQSHMPKVKYDTFKGWRTGRKKRRKHSLLP